MNTNPCYKMICRDELHNRMLASARNVFSVMADIVLDECHEPPEPGQENWVTALVGFEGTYNGLMALHCPEPMARRVAAGLLCETGEVAVQDLHDAMGEIANILGGDMKLYLDSEGRHVQLSIPSVFAGGQELQDEFLTGTETVACFLANGDERLLISVQVNRNQAEQVKPSF